MDFDLYYKMDYSRRMKKSRVTWVMFYRHFCQLSSERTILKAELIIYLLTGKYAPARMMESVILKIRHTVGDDCM